MKVHAYLRTEIMYKIEFTLQIFSIFHMAQYIMAFKRGSDKRSCPNYEDDVDFKTI